MPDEERTDRVEKLGLWARVMGIPEGKILAGGVVVTCLYLAGVGLTGVWSAKLSRRLLTMTGTHIIGGRAAGISWGYVHELRPWLVIVANLTVEAFMVLLFYPLFVLSYRKLIVIGPLKDSIARAQRVAQAHEAQIVKYGVPGLLLFVWFPFWMTGPLVGSVIGFLIGLRPWVNLTVVLAGTALATVSWAFVLQRVHEQLKVLGPYVPFLFVGLILFLAISIHIRYALWKHTPASEDDEEEGGED